MVAPQPGAPPSALTSMLGGGVTLRIFNAILTQPFFVTAVRCISDTSADFKKM
jgi:hypothetical protein